MSSRQFGLQKGHKSCELPKMFLGRSPQGMVFRTKGTDQSLAQECFSKSGAFLRPARTNHLSNGASLSSFGSQQNKGRAADAPSHVQLMRTGFQPGAFVPLRVEPEHSHGLYLPSHRFRQSWVQGCVRAPNRQTS